MAPEFVLAALFSAAAQTPATGDAPLVVIATMWRPGSWWRNGRPARQDAPPG